MESLLNADGTAAEGAVEFIDALQESRIPFVILCETSLFSRKELAEELNKRGFHGLQPMHFYTTVMAGVDLILSSHPEKRKADYIGEKGLEETLREGGMTITQKKPDWLFLSVDRQAEYSDYCRALQEVMQGTIMVAMDETPGMLRDGKWRIGSGAVMAMIEKASGKKALHAHEMEAALFERALLYMQADAQTTAYITADYRIGLRGAKKMHILTVLIMHGAISDDLLEESSEKQPDYVIDGYTGLLK